MVALGRVPAVVAALVVAPVVVVATLVVPAALVVPSVMVSRVMLPAALTVVAPVLLVVPVVALLLIGVFAVTLGRRGGRHQQRRNDQQHDGDDPHPHPSRRASSRRSGATHGHEPTSAPGPPRQSSQGAFNSRGLTPV